MKIVRSGARHHWFPRKYKDQIETLCRKINFKIDAFVTTLQTARDSQTNKVVPTYDDHYWIENARVPKWPDVAERNLLRNATCCTFLLLMMDDIWKAYAELRERAKSRGESWYSGDLETYVYSGKNPATGSEYSTDFPTSSGTSGGLVQFEYDFSAVKTGVRISASDS